MRLQRGAAPLSLHQIERREVSQIVSVVENQGSLDTCIGQEKTSLLLRQIASVLSHGVLSSFDCSRLGCRGRKRTYEFCISA